MEEIILIGKRILVVDDEVDLREIVASELEFMGAVVSRADDILAALKILDETVIDLVISDIRMPGGTGIDLLKAIRKKTASSQRVILVTGFADIRLEEAFAMGAEALMNKPFPLEELLIKASQLTSSFPDRWKRKEGAIKKQLNLSFPQSLENTINSHRLNFGRGGFAIIASSEGLQSRDLLTFEFKFEDLVLKGEGQVKWIKPHEGPSNLKLGVQFTWLDEASLKILSNLSSFTSAISWIPLL